MPAYTVAEQRALTLRRLRAPDTKRFSPTGGSADYAWIDDAIERAEEEFVRMTKCLRTWAVIQLKGGKRVYRLPTDCIDVMAAYYYNSSLSDGWKELVFTSIEKLNDEETDWRTSEDEPDQFYLDRKFGAGELLGLYPIPDQDGAAVSFASSYAAEVTWICPLYTGRQDFGRILRYNGTDSFVISNSDTVAIDAEVSSGNLLIEYYRLPHQRTEIPPEANKAISYFAASELLIDNDEDSAEYKRGVAMMQMFNTEVQTYVNRRKRPLSGTELRATPAVWGWVKNMSYRKELP